jgi:hypothetical protein
MLCGIFDPRRILSQKFSNPLRITVAVSGFTRE